jgi:hypothetical protein
MSLRVKQSRHEASGRESKPVNLKMSVETGFIARQPVLQWIE